MYKKKFGNAHHLVARALKSMSFCKNKSEKYNIKIIVPTKRGILKEANKLPVIICYVLLCYRSERFFSL